jgi:hypothetical protein
VLFFFPLSFTFVCPTELTAYSDKIKEFEKLDAQVLGISVDSQYAHLQWNRQPRNEGQAAAPRPEYSTEQQGAFSSSSSIQRAASMCLHSAAGLCYRWRPDSVLEQLEGRLSADPPPLQHPELQPLEGCGVVLQLH